MEVKLLCFQFIKDLIKLYFAFIGLREKEIVKDCLLGVLILNFLDN